MSGTPRLAFVSPRFPSGGNAGGAEVLLRALAVRATGLGYAVDFLTTCATNHFTWANDLPAGSRRIEGLDVHFFPVDGGRHIEAFLRVQEAICRGRPVSGADEETWFRNNVNSSALYAHLRSAAAAYDRIVAGPYLFSLTRFAAEAAPERTLMVPCLHDEPFARLSAVARLFGSVRGCLFNTEPERDLARRLYGALPRVHPVVGMGLEPFRADGAAFRARNGLTAPYLLYAGRREAMKGTPLLVDYFTAFARRQSLPLRLVLAGSGAVDIPPDVADRVLDVGFLSEQEKRDAMAGALAFCHPSTHESLSIVLLESWLAGTPALVHADGEVLRHQCARSGGGLWFRRYPEFEEQVLRLAGDPVLRNALAEAGRAFVNREYAWTAVERRLKEGLTA
jgi:glycosyltransferase involved in cell wall biosynthesis